MKKLSLFLISLIILICLFIYGYWPKTILMQGEIVIRQLNISPRIGGRIDTILAREGDTIKKGQPLATLYAPDMLAKASQVKAPRDLAQKSYARIQELYEGGVVSAQKLDEAKAKVKQAEGAVDATLTFVDEMTLYSPIDGEVSSVILENGELASPGISVLTVLDTSDVWATFNIREDLLSNFKLNDTVPVVIPALGKQAYNFRITYISKQGDYAVWSATKTRGEFDLKTFEVRLKPLQEIPQLRRGMTALITLHL